MNDRSPPHDEAAERGLLGHVLNTGRLPENLNGLAPSDFYQPAHETIWAAVLSLTAQQQNCGHLEVRTYLQQAGQLDRRGGVKSSDLVDLMGQPGVIEPGYAATTIHDHAEHRRIDEIITRLQQRSRGAEDVEALRRQAVEDLQALRRLGGERRSWQPVDLEPVLTGDWQPPQPTVGLRDDGRGIFYPGKGHSIVSETEGGKTWFALCCALDEMHAGNHVLYIDFEDDEGGVVGRLLTLGAGRDTIREFFDYIRPEHPLDSIGSADIKERIAANQPKLAVIDGITEAMAMHGWDPLNNRDAALFGRLLPRPIAALGPAVAALDHVKKERDGGRYALGAVHKLNALDGAGYLLENRTPFGVGVTGRSTIKITKDRPGQLRQHGLSSGSGMHWYGDLVLESKGEDLAEISIKPPHAFDAAFRPTKIMVAISDLLDSKGPLSQRVIRDLIGGRGQTVSRAISLLIADGYVDNKSPHKLLKPFREDSK